ncbi:M48 family metallopeptidase [Cytophagaceae bacterium DM2B3-1]|uniref:M48 family metallopeptidase n=1 Tax=Xanthocytophaga flava TaxID=3048013 RepID=A0AAE3QNG6_9BACT|nr:M48 family metallopeptidase [Xanthocytophaga flavus]MDJ1467690.1 M48 family metallopeptidase [Xanthocytophaga flavus]MDJ1479813.1 M48 family metallopeptidase [Xanthocytophaga flavus]MDJ1493770.1 M48 family metallopeptidase [Xanthocytophaga flavus]
MRKLSKFLLSLTIVGGIISCQKVPITGRSQLNFIPDSEMNAMALQAYTQFLTENKPVSNSQADMVKRVGARVQAALEKLLKERNQSNAISGFKWEYNLVDSKELNAWCMPGGKVVVYTGLLPVTQNEAGLAVVMGHEIAHAVARHGSERSSQQMVTNGLLQAGGVVVGQNPTLVNQIVLQAAGAGTQLGLLSHSRSQESEADEIGLYVAALAGYDPQESVKLWQRMAEASKGSQKPPEFLSTHPSDATRISRLQKLMPKALQYYNQSKK